MLMLVPSLLPPLLAGCPALVAWLLGCLVDERKVDGGEERRRHPGYMCQPTSDEPVWALYHHRWARRPQSFFLDGVRWTEYVHATRQRQKASVRCRMKREAGRKTLLWRCFAKHKFLTFEGCRSSLTCWLSSLPHWLAGLPACWLPAAVPLKIGFWNKSRGNLKTNRKIP